MSPLCGVSGYSRPREYELLGARAAEENPGTRPEDLPTRGRLGAAAEGEPWPGVRAGSDPEQRDQDLQRQPGPRAPQARGAAHGPGAGRTWGARPLARGAAPRWPPAPAGPEPGDLPPAPRTYPEVPLEQ